MEFKKTRRYRVVTTTYNSRFALKTYRAGFECVSLRLARALVRDDIKRTIDRFPGVDLTVNYGMKETTISCDDKVVLKFQITYIGDGISIRY